MNKYDQLIEENQRFWQSLDLNNTTANATDFATLAEEAEDDPLVLIPESVSI